MTYHGQWKPSVDEVLFLNYFSDIKNGFFIECGAGNGIADSSCLFFEEHLGWNGINIEPCPDVYNVLVLNRPKATNLCLALSDNDGTAKLTLVNYGGVGVGSITGEWHPKWKRELTSFGFTFLETQIYAITYRSLISKYEVTPSLLVLDVDGHELQVIDGMTGAQYLPEVICVEYTLVGLHNLISKLYSLGYNYDFLSYNNAFFSRGQKQHKNWFGETEIWKYDDTSI
jgi:FkbM family methyltransferase